MPCCEECGDEARRRAQCINCHKLICPFCMNHSTHSTGESHVPLAALTASDKRIRRKMFGRLPWGHKSRHCVFCGKVGPRTIVAGGYAHKRCLIGKEVRAVDRVTALKTAFVAGAESAVALAKKEGRDT